jgi:hypothetical protein
MNNNLHLQIVKEYELYIPQFENGIYVNYIPHDLTNGYKCNCGARKNHIFNDEIKFKKHFKTKCHIKWLESLNENKVNYYNSYIENEKIIKTLKIIINEKDKELNKKNIEIHKLKTELQSHENNCNIDLLSF